MGASLGLSWARLAGSEDMGILAQRGYEAAACVLDPEAVDLRAWARPERLALVLGNEAFGLSEAWLGSCPHRITLPMSGGTDSLNLATAAAIFLYALG
jgi:tRNA G18 (ribose-2'-O)-methylase SpoU